MKLIFSCFSTTSLSTSRFISSSAAKANRSPTDCKLEVLEIGEYHLGNILGYSPVLAISYPESSGFLVSGWAPVETLGYWNFVTARFLR